MARGLKLQSRPSLSEIISSDSGNEHQHSKGRSPPPLAVASRIRFLFSLGRPLSLSLFSFEILFFPPLAPSSARGMRGQHPINRGASIKTRLARPANGRGQQRQQQQQGEGTKKRGEGSGSSDEKARGWKRGRKSG